MPQITIDPKHARLQAFLAGKGIHKSNQPATLEVSDMELRSLLRKAKEHGFEDLIKAPKVKKAKVEAPTEPEPMDEAPSDETTANETTDAAEEDAAPKRRRKVQ